MPKKTQAEVRNLKVQLGMYIGLPASARQEDEQTLDQFAKKIGVARETLSRWRNDPLVVETAQNAVLIWGGNDKLEILKQTISDAKKGHTGAQRLYYEVMGMIGHKKSPQDVPAEFTVKFIEDK